ncbi:hypothetical protein [Streptomyces sp. NBC_00057]|uniref:hypothetical protein n=1 Tax=Streptomyces sp. NBC_00057 TaxID=2975634 RepID=UPI002F913618
MDQADQNEDPTGVAAVLAYGALQTVEQAVPEFRHSALNRLGRTDEADAEARRGLQDRAGAALVPAQPERCGRRRRCDEGRRHRQGARCRVPTATRLKQLREQAAARTEQAAAAPWTDWLPELAARRLGGDAGAVIA